MARAGINISSGSAELWASHSAFCLDLLLALRTAAAIPEPLHRTTTCCAGRLAGGDKPPAIGVLYMQARQDLIAVEGFNLCVC